ncbi:hypothetical protein [Halomonas sp. 707B3]|uniref:hypothetical protein n=1 Tax=Halomonas sp. 707B3 TaxID=1681043 RepID=UPI00209EA6C5|nr:hypothetical protein [Halomonas sp. 707B3]MCP1316373.1 hypothetical protein [Halomonas sp. 707B3]
MTPIQIIRINHPAAGFVIHLEQLSCSNIKAHLFDSRFPTFPETVFASSLESALVGCCKLIRTQRHREAHCIRLYKDPDMLTNELILSVLSRYMMWSRDVRYV